MHHKREPDPLQEQWLDRTTNNDFNVHNKVRLQAELEGALTSRITEIDPPLLAVQPPNRGPRQEVDITFQSYGDRMFSPAEWKIAQRNDPDLQALRTYIALGRSRTEHLQQDPISRTCQHYLNISGAIFTTRLDGLLRYNRRVSTPLGGMAEVSCLLAPRNFWGHLTKWVHMNHGHRDATAVAKRLQQQVYWPRMLEDAKTAVQDCGRCYPFTPTLGVPLPHPPLNGYAWEVMCLSFVGPFAASAKGRYLLLVRCQLTKWLEVFPTHVMAVTAVADQLETVVFKRLGRPTFLHADDYSLLPPEYMSDLAHIIGIRLTMARPPPPATLYNASGHSYRDLIMLGFRAGTAVPVQAYGDKVDKPYRDLKAIIDRLTPLTKKEQWNDYVQRALWIIRTARCEVTTGTLYTVLFNHRPENPLSWLFGERLSAEQQQDRPDDWRRTVGHRLHATYSYSGTRGPLEIHRARLLYRGDQHFFIEQQCVWVWTPVVTNTTAPTHGPPKVYRRLWTGPWTIEEMINPITYRVRPRSSWAKNGCQIVSVERIQPFRPEDGIGPLITGHPSTSSQVEDFATKDKGHVVLTGVHDFEAWSTDPRRPTIRASRPKATATQQRPDARLHINDDGHVAITREPPVGAKVVSQPPLRTFTPIVIPTTQSMTLLSTLDAISPVTPPGNRRRTVTRKNKAKPYYRSDKYKPLPLELSVILRKIPEPTSSTKQRQPVLKTASVVMHKLPHSEIPVDQRTYTVAQSPKQTTTRRSPRTQTTVRPTTTKKKVPPMTEETTLRNDCLSSNPGTLMAPDDSHKNKVTELGKFMKLNDNVVEVTFKCMSCPYSTSADGDMIQHHISAHPVTMNTPPQSPMISADESSACH